jgi:catechol 2,3-dioxygenase-like lactoylglutathione lyase family enzyme
MARVGDLSEVILYVADMDRMYEFYTDTLGLPVARGAPEHGFVALDTGGCELCLHAGGEESTGAGVPKVVFSVDELDAARSSLTELGVEMGEIRDGGPDTRVCDGRDPEGNPFALEAPRSD